MVNTTLLERVQISYIRAPAQEEIISEIKVRNIAPVIDLACDSGGASGAKSQLNLSAMMTNTC
jgi:hypothetical protein